MMVDKYTQVTPESVLRKASELVPCVLAALSGQQFAFAAGSFGDGGGTGPCGTARQLVLLVAPHFGNQHEPECNQLPSLSLTWPPP